MSFEALSAQQSLRLIDSHNLEVFPRWLPTKLSDFSGGFLGPRAPWASDRPDALSSVFVNFHRPHLCLPLPNSVRPSTLLPAGETNMSTQKQNGCL